MKTLENIDAAVTAKCITHDALPALNPNALKGPA